MSLKDRIVEDLNTAGRGPKCAVTVTLDAMSATDADELREVLEDVTIPVATLNRALAAEGYKVSTGTLSRHRKRMCNCA